MKQEMGGTFSTYGEGRGAYSVLVGKPKGMRQLGRTRCRWQDNINMDGRAWSGLICFRIGTGGGLLRMQQ